ncbi:MAG: hypothetical protein KME29_21785 [Calothrix sp. FI2-JRJ7]|jgi:hypothetical protein|nr:hypothetical protein [Calothrix sp. FI2-JRJ7]
MLRHEASQKFEDKRDSNLRENCVYATLRITNFITPKLQYCNLSLLKVQNFCNYLEIETYTWEVLPHDMNLDLITSIQREYEWIMQKLCWIESKISSSF